MSPYHDHQTCVAISDALWHLKWHQKSKYKQLSHTHKTTTEWAELFMSTDYTSTVTSLDTDIDVSKFSYLLSKSNLIYLPSPYI